MTFHPHPNSLAAYDSMKGDPLCKVDALILAALSYRPMATWEIEAETGRKHQTISAAMNSLRNRGAIVVVGTNLTDSRRRADVYALTNSEEALAAGAYPTRTDRRGKKPPPAPLAPSPRRVDAPTKDPTWRCLKPVEGGLCMLALADAHETPFVRGFVMGKCPLHKTQSSNVRQ